MSKNQQDPGPQLPTEHPDHSKSHRQESALQTKEGNEKSTPRLEEKSDALKQESKGEPPTTNVRSVYPQVARTNTTPLATGTGVEQRKRLDLGGIFRRSLTGRESISSSPKLETEGSRGTGHLIPDHQPAVPPNRLLRPHPLKPATWNYEADPWQPIVLSLDGGGIRGLSSLYILRDIMVKIQAEETRVESHKLRPVLTGNGWESTTTVSQRQGDTLPLPCDYFDFIIGTSTGGLIAVMLGRLRMDVDECIKAYKTLGLHIFGHLRWWRLTKYDYRNLEDAIKNVVKKNCVEHGDAEPCNGEHDLLRQYDFSCEDGPCKNRTCKVYDHEEAVPQQYQSFDANELNPGRVQRNAVTIWEACRATSAAPLYFNKVMIRGVRYMDGGVGAGANNPAAYALNEAEQMAQRRGQTKSIAAMISVGTGQKKAQSRFKNIFAILNHARRLITETQGPHNAVQTQLTKTNTPYFRFDVPPPPDVSVDPGLSKMGLDECKKKKRKKSQRNPAGTVNGALDETKYDYQTYEKIRICTEAYCSQSQESVTVPINVQAELTEAANVLVWYSRLREQINRERWVAFTKHPYHDYAARPRQE
ncbi:acyl transferase/acyl hydrolase/lysophospholipase [Lophiotrema nucula]|uniref:Acyl transferase/acyl hydrolase/lysophospholipase n=1 Tax=Lophiotrema nucula TaxID=690887 RepID=A0A6A5ZTV3_9PLEO|nr:acyl transferase/acyl hydrolase/lysophospholipase [Lophiotrema nucula]